MSFISLQIIVEVSCSAAGPWGLVSVIESVMVEQARVGMKGFLDFCGREFNHRQISAESLILDEPKSSVSEDTSEFQDALSEASNAGKHDQWLFCDNILILQTKSCKFAKDIVDVSLGHLLFWLQYLQNVKDAIQYERFFNDS